MSLKDRISRKKDEIKAINFKRHRNIQKFAIRIVKFMGVSNRIDEHAVKYENNVLNVCRRLLREEDSEFSMTPETHRRVIKNKRLGIKILIKNMTVTIHQNKTSYTTFFSDKNYNYLITQFNKKKESDMDIDEAEITEDVKDSMKTIYNYIVDNSIKNEK